MASSIGAYTFLSMRGPQIPLLASAVEIIDRPGVDGVAHRINALKATEITLFTLEGIELKATANGRADDYAALKGTTVTIVDDQGRSVDDVLIVEVRVLSPPQYVLNPQPTGNNYLVKAAWVVKPTSGG